MKRNKCKNIILLCIVCLVTVLCIPAKQVSASEVLVNTPETLVWGQSYSGELESNNKSQQYTQYTFTLSQSGHIGMVCNVEGDPMNIGIYDSAQNCVCKVSVAEGMTNQAFELLKGEYTMKITPGWYAHCKYSFTPTFTASGETKSESYDEKNNETGLATSYMVGDSYTGHLADNDDMDIYKMEVTRNGNLTVSVDSKLKDYDIKLVNDYGDISYEDDVTSGKHKYSYFVPKGTYYLQFLRGDNTSTGIYSFNTSLSAIPKGKLSSAKNVKTCSIQVKWGKNSKVTGYQLQISTNKKFSKSKKSFYINDNTTSSTKIYNVKKHKIYYVRVRNYITAPNGKSYYSKWSSSKKVSIRM